MRARRVIAFYPELVDLLGSINSAIFYQQLYYWSDKGSREDGFVYKSRKEIEDETTLSRFQQESVVENLVKLGWLETKKEKANGAPTIHYKCLFDIRLMCEKLANGYATNSQMDMQETRQSSIHKITQESTTEEMPASLSLTVTKTNTIRGEAFEKFWAMYPKKMGRKPAEASWRKVKPEDYDKVMRALTRHRKSEQWTKNNGQFIPNATTWLNQERWDDEVVGSSERKEIIL